MRRILPTAKRVRTAILAVSLIAVWLPNSEAQEYLEAEDVAPESLEETPTSFEGLSIPDTVGRRRLLSPVLIEKFPPLEPVARDSVFHFEPRSYYFYRKYGDGSIAEAWTLGGSLTYESGWWRDILMLGAAAYTSQRLHGPADRDGTGLLQTGQKSYSALGQLYAKAKIGSSAEATLYRQELDLPYVNRHDIRMTPNTFEGYTIATEELSNWTFVGGHLTQMKSRLSSDFSPMSTFTGAEESNQGVTLGGFKYRFSEEAGVGVVNYFGWDTLNIFYTEAKFDHACSNDIDTSVRFQFSSQNDVGKSLAGTRDGQLYGMELSAGWNSLIGSLGLTSRQGDAITKPWGGDPSFNSVITSDFDRDHENALRVGISYDFEEMGLPGLSAFSSFTWGDTPDIGVNASPDQTEFDFTVDYRVQEGFFENCWLRFRVADNDFSAGGNDRLDLRIIANYSVHF